MSWPPFLPNQVLLGNPQSNVAIICGWSPRNKFKETLEKHDPEIMKKVAAIGNLYTAQRGVDILVRNILARPQINTLIFCGRDKSGASEQAATFFTRGGYKCRLLRTESGQEYYASTVATDVKIWANIPFETIEILREMITVIRVKDNDPVTVAQTVDIYNGKGDPLFAERIIYDPPKMDPEIFPAPDNVQVLRTNTVAEGWLELLHYIMTFGKRVPTHYDQETLEIMNLVMVITDQDPYEHMSGIPTYLPFNPRKIEEYCKSLLSPVRDEGVTYTYGNRMRAHFGVDQLTYVAQKLADDRDSRSVVINLWDATRREQGSPCLNHLWFRIMKGRLHMTATIRSNDMFLGWPENAYGLCYLQDWVRCMILKFEGEFQDDKGLGMGDLVINSQSAHLYDDCWESAKDLVDKHRKYREWHDEKGQWTFEADTAGDPPDVPRWRITKRPVIATLHSPEGEHLTTIEGSPNEVRREIARRGLISDVGHALYVGQMLEKTARGE